MTRDQRYGGERRGGRKGGGYLRRDSSRRGRDYDRHFIREDRGNDQEYDSGFIREDVGNSGGDQGYGWSRDHEESLSGGGGDRMRNYGFLDRGRGFYDGDSRGKYQSGGADEEYAWRMNGVRKINLCDYQWDRRLEESRNGFRSSVLNGAGETGLRGDLNYSYEVNTHFDKCYDEMVVDGSPVVLESERKRDCASSSFLVNSSFPTRSSVHIDGIGSASRYSSSGPLEDEEFSFHDKFVTGGPVMRGPYKDKLLLNQLTDHSFKENSISSSRDGHSLSYDSHGLGSAAMTNGTVGYDGLAEKVQSSSPENHEARYSDPNRYPLSYVSTAEDDFRGYEYPKVELKEDGKFGNSLDVGGEYNLQDRSRVACQGKFYHGPRRSLLGELSHDDEVVGTPRFCHGRLDVLPLREYEMRVGYFGGKSDDEMMMGNVTMSRTSSPSLKRKHAKEQHLDVRNMEYDPMDESAILRNHRDPMMPSENLRVGNSDYREFGRGLKQKGRSSSRTVLFPSSSHVRKSRLSGPGDVKKRLGPLSDRFHVSQHLTKKRMIPSLKKRLGRHPKKIHSTLPWLKKLNAPYAPMVQDESCGSAALQGEDYPEDNVAPAKSEPPENSEDFKQLVRIAFFKFVKQLNETPTERRKYKDQGSAGSLNCIICCSSEEFGSTESLAAHALTCQMPGVRSQHLGFHKALCALMGWKFVEQSTSSTWSCEMLPEMENMALKEDLILWPPVVIIHNSSSENKIPIQQVNVTMEEVEAKLRDLGFGDKAKICRGKPANQSTLVVEFPGTLSGLLEAKRLHKVFADKDHGRAKFLLLESSSNQNQETETQAEFSSLKNLDSILYGYLGLAEDFHQLDIDANKRRVVKSKKEIEDIAETPVMAQYRN